MKGCLTRRDGLFVMWGVRSAEKECRAAGFTWQSLIFRLQVYRVSRRLQDRQRIERCDAALAACVPSLVGLPAAIWNAKRCAASPKAALFPLCGGERWRFFGGRGVGTGFGFERVELHVTIRPRSEHYIYAMHVGASELFRLSLVWVTRAGESMCTGSHFNSSF